MSLEDTIRGLKIASTLTIGYFSGAAAYVMIAVQPSLIDHKNVASASKIMRGMLTRSAVMPLSCIAHSATALCLYYKTRGTDMEDRFWLVSGVTMLAMIPYTVKFIAPINGQFRKEPEPTFDDSDEKWRNLLSDWLTFHTPRAILGFTLFSIGVYKLSR